MAKPLDGMITKCRSKSDWYFFRNHFTAQASLVELALEGSERIARSGPPEDAIGEGVSKLGGRHLPGALQRLLLSRARLDVFRFLLQRLTFLARELGNQRVDERAGVRRHQSAARKDG